MKELKQVIVVRTDLGMSPGKLAAQVAHASLTAFLTIFETDMVNKILELPMVHPAFRQWADDSQVKIVLAVKDNDALVGIYNDAQNANLPRAIIMDEGRTELTGKNYTTVAIGPAHPDEIDALTGDLPLL